MKHMLKLTFFILLATNLVACSSDKVAEQPQSTQPQTKTSQNVGAPVEPAAPTVDLAKAADYNIQLGVAYLQRGQVQRAKSKLLLAQKQQPDSATVMSALGYFYEATGETQLAEQSYKDSVDAAPHSGNILNNYGTFLCRQKKYQDAEKYFMKAVKEPTYLHTAEAYENAGLCATLQPNMIAAEKYFSKALRYDPKRTTSLYEMATITHKEGKNVLAARYLRRFNANTKPTPSSLWLEIQVQSGLGNKNAVASNALLLKNKFPESPAYQEYRKWQAKQA